MPLQKIFLLPPLKGLNLYDNPFTMSPDFAVELENFMPPTTIFSVRPGVKFLLTLPGQVRGIYSYTTGKTVSYGENWYNTNIKYGAAKLLLVKVIETSGKTILYSVDPQTLSATSIGELPNSNYNDDSALYKHTMFFLSGDTNSVGFLFHQSIGLAKFVLMLGEDLHQTVGDMQCITMFKNILFMSGGTSLNIFYIDAKYADTLDPQNSQVWKTIENLFAPHGGKTLSLDGIVQNGGSIIKLANMSRGGSDSLSTYLMAITDMGEIVLFDGTDPSKPETWAVAGRFQIAPPLNRWAMCEMDGDYIVATKNGLISLRRVLFGQASQITENLEYRLLSLFSQYMFKNPAISEFISLYYHPRNRLLIFNVPTMIPIPFNKLVEGYEFDDSSAIIFRSTNNGLFNNNDMSLIYAFVRRYLLENLINYTITINLNELSQNYIKVIFDAQYDSTTSSVIYSLSLMYRIAQMQEDLPLLRMPIQYKCLDIYHPTPNLELLTSPTDCGWSDSLRSVAGSGIITYSLRLEKGIVSRVSNVSSHSARYASKPTLVTLGNLIPGTSLESFTQIIMADYFSNPYNVIVTKDHQYVPSIPLEDFYNSKEWGREFTHEMLGDAEFHNVDCKLIASSTFVSPLKIMISIVLIPMFDVVNTFGNVVVLSTFNFIFEMNFAFDGESGQINGKVKTVATFKSYANDPAHVVSVVDKGAFSMTVEHSVTLFDHTNKELASYHINYPISIGAESRGALRYHNYYARVPSSLVAITYNNKNFMLNLNINRNFHHITGSWTMSGSGKTPVDDKDFDVNPTLTRLRNATSNIMPLTFTDQTYTQNLSYLLSNFILFNTKNNDDGKEYIVISDIESPFHRENYGILYFSNYMYSSISGTSVYLHDFFSDPNFYSGYGSYYKDEIFTLAPVKIIAHCFESALNFQTINVFDSIDMTYTLHADYVNGQQISQIKLIITVGNISRDENHNVTGTISLLYQYTPNCTFQVNYNITALRDGNYYNVNITFAGTTPSTFTPLEISITNKKFSFSFIETSGWQNVPDASHLDYFTYYLGNYLKDSMKKLTSEAGWKAYGYLFSNIFLSVEGVYPPLPGPPPAPPIGNLSAMGNITPSMSFTGYDYLLCSPAFLDVHFDNFSPSIHTETGIETLMALGTGSTYHSDPDDNIYLDPTNKQLKSVVLSIVSVLFKSYSILRNAVSDDPDNFQDYYYFKLNYNVGITEVSPDNVDLTNQCVNFYLSIMPHDKQFNNEFDATLYMYQYVKEGDTSNLTYYCKYSFNINNNGEFHQVQCVPTLQYASFYQDYQIELNPTAHYTLKFPAYDQNKWHDVTYPVDTPPSWMLSVAGYLNNTFFSYTELNWIPGISWLFNNLNFKNSLNPNKKGNTFLPKKKVSAQNLQSTYITNVNLASVPLLNLMDIFCNYKSTQYVFDSHFGTWSSFTGINMIKGVEHSNDFYFIVPNDLIYDEETKNYKYTTSSLCKFEPEQHGDDDLTEPTKQKSIIVSYKTVPTFDFGIPQKKIFKRTRIFGTPSAFWQSNSQGVDANYPFIITPFSDFKEGQSVSFIHAYDKVLSQTILKNYFKNKMLHELNFLEKKKYWELYQAANDNLTQISIPLIANPGTRFGLQLDMEIKEAFVDIYGFEIFFEVTNISF